MKKILIFSVVVVIAAVFWAKVRNESGNSETQQPAAAQSNLSGENPLLNPESEAMNQQAPETFQVKFETSKGDFTVQVQRDWAPYGADRFYNLVRHGFYNGVRFFRVLKEPRMFMAQFGISGDPQISQIWGNRGMPDDPVIQNNQRGYLTYAKTNQPNSRSTQLFINYTDNSFLNAMDFAPFGQVIEGMEVIDEFYGGYGEGAPRGNGPDQARIQSEGNAYLEKEFPQLDWIKRAYLL